MIAWAPAVVLMGAIFFLSCRPAPHSRHMFPGADKLAHAVVYGALALLWRRALRLERSPLADTFAIAAASVYGASDEIHQYFVPFRSFQLSDWLADTAGAWAAVTLATRAHGSRR